MVKQHHLTMNNLLCLLLLYIEYQNCWLPSKRKRLQIGKIDINGITKTDL